jgi:predicted amidohydrolase
MSVDVDLAPRLRARLLDLYHWFRDDMNRLVDAQAAWRADELWADRRAAEVTHLLGGRLSSAPSTVPARALFELECVDLALWQCYRRVVPPRLVGTGERARFVVRLARRRDPLAAHQANLLSTHMRYHAIVPPTVTATGGATFRVRFAAHDTPRCTEPRDRGAVEVATTSFADGSCIEWCRDDRSARAVPAAEQRTTALSQALRDAAAAGVDLLIAPELTVPPEHRARLFAELRSGGRTAPRVALALLGSFHERRVDRHGSERVYNVAILVDGFGNQVVEHRKLVPFGDHGEVGAPTPEAISVGHEITLVQTPIGLVAVAICKDFCDVHVGTVWRELQPEWLLVPAYGDGATAHQRAAHAIALVSATVTVVAHEPKHSEAGAGASFVHDRERVATPGVAPAFGRHSVKFPNT